MTEVRVFSLISLSSRVLEANRNRYTFVPRLSRSYHRTLGVGVNRLRESERMDCEELLKVVFPLLYVIDGDIKERVDYSVDPLINSLRVD